MTTISKALWCTQALALALGVTLPAHAADEVHSSFDELLDRELATPGGLTADDAARAALHTNPLVKARAADVEAADADVSRATLGYVPIATVGARYTRLSDIGQGQLGNLVVAPGQPAGPIPAGAQLVNAPVTFEMPLNQYTLQASLTVPVSDYLLRVGPNRDAAVSTHAATRQYALATEHTTAANARIAYYDWVRGRFQVIVAQAALAQSQAHLTDAKSQFEAGAGSQADVLRVESLVAKNELLIVRAQNLDAKAEEQLRTYMHAPRTQTFHIAEDLRPASLGRPLPPMFNLWQEAEHSRPEIAAANLAQDARESGIQYDRAAYVPRVDLFADAQYSNPNSRVFPTKAEFRGSWDAGVALSWTISDLPSTVQRVKGDEARYQSKEAERDDLLDQIHLEVMSAQQSLQETRVSQGTTKRQLDAAEESYRARKLLFENGRATTGELIDAETDLTQARLDAINAHIDARVAEVRLARALGRGACLTPNMPGRRIEPAARNCP